MERSARLKPWALLLLRLGTGLLLILWGALRVMTPAAGPGLAAKYYAGFMASGGIQIAYGAAEIAIGILVALGLFRRVAYPLQAIILVPATLLLWRYLLDPLGMYLMDQTSSQILFFPSITVAAATLVLLAFRDADRLSLDFLLASRRNAREHS